MKWSIITDSSCDMFMHDVVEGDTEIHVETVPFIISVGPIDFVDSEDLDVPEMVDAMEKERKASASSCPAPATWLDLYRREGNVIAITISKELSGSYNSAALAMNMMLEEDPNKNIVVINSVSAGPGLNLIVDAVKKAILAGKDYAEVSAIAQQTATDARTIFALASYKNLIKNGRMSPLVGFAAQTLGFWGLGVATEIGTIDIRGKMRGAKKAMAFIVDDIKAQVKEQNREFSTAFISHCMNPETAELLKSEILKVYPNMEITIQKNRGLCSYYAERNGIMVAYN